MVVLSIRNGKLLGRRNFSLKGQEFPTQEILSSFVSLYYDLGAFIPDEVLLPEPVADAATKSEWLSEKRGARRGVEVLSPQRGQRHDLVDAGAEERGVLVRHPARQVARRRGGDGQAAAAAQLEAAATAHRVLRHLAHPGHGDGGVDGGVPRRRAGQGRVPHLQGQERDQRRLRIDVRGAVAPLPPQQGRRRQGGRSQGGRDEEGLGRAGPAGDRRRQGAALDGGGGAARRADRHRHERHGRGRAGQGARGSKAARSSRIGSSA